MSCIYLSSSYNNKGEKRHEIISAYDQILALCSRSQHRRKRSISAITHSPCKTSCSLHINIGIRKRSLHTFKRLRLTAYRNGHSLSTRRFYNVQMCIYQFEDNAQSKNKENIGAKRQQ